MDLIRVVISDNKSLIFTDDMVRSTNWKPEQNTLILRDISSSTPIDDVRQIFTDANCPIVQSIRADMNDIWYVVFSSEIDARAALAAIANAKFENTKIKARLKTESIAKYSSRYVEVYI